MENEWKIVTSADKRRVMRKHRGKRRANQTTTSTQALLNPSLSLTQPERLLLLLKEAQKFLKQSDLWEQTKSLLSTLTIQHVVCYGLGNFSQTSATCLEAPLWQLGFLCCLREELSVGESISFFDPVSTADELSFLQKQLHIQPLAVNDRGIRPSSKETLFFMPHCPWIMYENVLFSNWENRILVIGNSLRDVADRHSCPCLQASTGFLSEQALVASRRDLEGAPGNLLGAFNDTYVCSWRSEKWPSRPYNDALSMDDPELV